MAYVRMSPSERGQLDAALTRPLFSEIEDNLSESLAPVSPRVRLHTFGSRALTLGDGSMKLVLDMTLAGGDHSASTMFTGIDVLISALSSLVQQFPETRPEFDPDSVVVLGVAETDDDGDPVCAGFEIRSSVKLNLSEFVRRVERPDMFPRRQVTIGNHTFSVARIREICESVGWDRFRSGDGTYNSRAFTRHILSSRPDIAAVVEAESARSRSSAAPWVEQANRNEWFSTPLRSGRDDDEEDMDNEEEASSSSRPTMPLMSSGDAFRDSIARRLATAARRG